MPKVTTRSRIAAVLFLVGAILLIAAFLAPWYSYDQEWAGGSVFNHGTQNATYYLGPPWASGPISYTCSGNAMCLFQPTYSDAHENNTGLVAAISSGLLIAGCSVGTITAILAVVVRPHPGRPSPVISCALLALFLAIAAPVVFSASLSGAFSRDFPNATCGGTSYPGPWSSFSGSATAICGMVGSSYSWGPLIGWYLSIAAAVVLMVAVMVLLLTYRKGPRHAAPPPSRTPRDASTVPPSRSPIVPNEEGRLANSLSPFEVPRSERTSSPELV